MEQHPMAEAAQERQNWESLGHGGDMVYIPGPEDDMSDPDSVEIINMVQESYHRQNVDRRERELRTQNDSLRELLEAHDIAVPDDI